MRGAVLSISSGECLAGAVKCSNAYEPIFIGHGEIPITRIFLIGLAAMTIEALGAMVKNDLAKWGPIIKAVIKN